ncbi:MAG: DVUA0089 family protein [Gammaproteobacteria bacterium]
MKLKLGMIGSVLVGALAFAGSASATPMNYSYQGAFTQDDNVQLFNFSVTGAASQVYLVSYGYAGGTQADGTVVSGGGLDTILTLFNGATGAYITANDDGSDSCFSGATSVAPGIVDGNYDPNTGVRYDTCFSSLINPGNYTVAVTEYDNFAAGSNLSDGFQRDGQGNFTGALGGCSQGYFCDVTDATPYNNRTGAWAYDILNVSSATQVPQPPTGLPEPGSIALMAIGMIGLGASRRRRPAR